MLNITKNLKNLERRSFDNGGCAILHKAILINGNSGEELIVAVKIPNVHDIETNEGEEREAIRAKVLRRWKREIDAGQSVSHPNVLPFLGFCDNPEPAYREFVGIVLPFCKNGNARMYIKRNPEVDRLRIIVLAAAAFFALHTHLPPIVHGDFKSLNILIDEHVNPLLGDFGLSRICNTRGFTTKNITGSIRWMSPELLRASTDAQSYSSNDDDVVRTTQSSDVWAFGMTVLELLTGKHPFAEYTELGVIIGVVSDQVRPVRPHTPLIGNSLWKLLESCWAEEPSARPDARHVGLVLDLLFGLGHDHVNAHAVSEILNGALDNIFSSPHAMTSHAALPYSCKWLHCTKTFRNIDACVKHECNEFNWRRAEANRQSAFL